MKRITLRTLKKFLTECLKETSSTNSKNIFAGQCAVTALIVQDIFGGKIVWAEVVDNGKKVSHYFNLNKKTRGRLNKETIFFIGNNT